MSEAQARRDFALEVVLRLRAAGFQALWAGGCVRDLILGLEPADYDVATEATPEQVMLTLPFRAVTVGISFGVVRVRHLELHGIEVEVATFRSDGAYVDGRRPVVGRLQLARAGRVAPRFHDQRHVHGPGIEPGDRLRRRARRPAAPGPPRHRRPGASDSARTSFACCAPSGSRPGSASRSSPTTREAVRAMAAEVVVVSAERIAQELRRMLVHERRALAMDLALDLGLVAAILPPLVEMRGLFQGKPMQPEGDLWDHTMLVLRLLPPNPSFTLAFAALVHDVGKPFTRSNRLGRTSFHNHDQVGSRIADRLCRNLRLSNAERERITWLVAFHQYLGEAKKLRESKLKRMLAQPGIEELLALHRADALASTGDTEQVDYCAYYLEAPARRARSIRPRC